MTRVDVPEIGVIDVEWCYDALWLWIGGSLVVGSGVELLTSPPSGERAVTAVWFVAGAVVVYYTVSNARRRAAAPFGPPDERETG